VREIDVGEIRDAVVRLAGEVAYRLGDAERAALEEAREREESEPGRAALGEIIENADCASKGIRPICQDTGLGVVFIDVGQDVHITGGSLEDGVNEGMRRAVSENYLRASACDPFTRANSGDGVPAILHVRIVPGDRVKIIFDAKGGGSENCSRLSMLAPADGGEGVKAFAVETVEKAGAKSCPPLVVGVGVGGNFETCAVLAKRALVRELGSPNPDPDIASLEKDILEAANATGVGPSGLGGRVTVLAVHVEAAPCHIAGLPVAVNLDCHAHRHGGIEL
jgi:fumarate hydratase subunit alpha